MAFSVSATRGRAKKWPQAVFADGCLKFKIDAKNDIFLQTITIHISAFTVHNNDRAAANVRDSII
jgi:hypothetical protein